jgi:hypothetical protein
MPARILGPVVHTEPEDRKMKTCNSANGRYLVGAAVALVSSIAAVAFSFGHAVTNMQAFI